MKKLILSILAALIVIGVTVYLVQFLPSYRLAAEQSTVPPAPPHASWTTTNLPDAWSATASVMLPPGVVPFDISNTAGVEHIGGWTLPPAYLEKTRTMKTMHLNPSSPYDLAGCLVDPDLEQVTSETDQTIANTLFCVQVGTSVGAGQAYETTLYSSKDSSVPLAVSFNIHYANSVQVYAGCEKTADLTKPECSARQLNLPDDTQLFADIMATLQVKK